MERITVDLPKEWLSVADIRDYMDVSPFVVASRLRSGALPGVKFGHEWRIARTDFEDWLNDQRAAANSTTSPTPTAAKL
ncbi:MAG: helix-turn-helix domain-containing protein [Acidobacteria bacterium]|nr:helix-turn-helix domain-containing protein [Acidobacteriota bacterium]